MKYFFEAGMGRDSPSPGADLGQTQSIPVRQIE